MSNSSSVVDFFKGFKLMAAALQQQVSQIATSRSFLRSRVRQERWAIILAGGDGTRLQSMTRAITGDDRPKQFVPIGTVWPWLMGPYLSEYEKTFGAEAVKRIGTQWLARFEGHLQEGCPGQVSEIFEGDAPHAPRGCAAQAWSVSEILRAALGNIYQQKLERSTTA